MKTQDIKNLASAYMQVLEAEKKMDKVNPKALDKDFDDREDKDIDNDGDVDNSDEYLHNRRKAVKKAMKNEEADLTEESKTIAKVKEIVANKGAMKIDGVMVDMFTASAIAQIYDKVNDANKAKMDKMKITQLANAAFKIMKRMKEEVELSLDEEFEIYEGYAKSAAQQAAIAIAKKEKGMSEDDDLDELSLSVKDFKKTGLNKTVTKDKDKLKKDIEAMKSRLKKEEVEIDEAAPKMRGDSFKQERDRARAHDAAMGRTATGRKKPVRQMTSTQRSLASLRREEVEDLDEAKLLSREDVAKLVVKKLGNKKFKADRYAQIAAIKEILKAHPRQKILATDREFIDDVLGILYNKHNLKYVKEEVEDLDEAMSKATRRALQSVKAQPKDKVSLKPAPWDKKKDAKNMSMKEKLQLQKEAILEREMTDAEMKKREEIVKGMKKDSEDMKKRYGSRWKDVMYATATKQAMESVDKALSMTKGLLTTKESFDTEDTKWPVYAKIKENRAMHTRGAAPGDPTMMDKMTASDKAFIDAHDANGLGGRDSGIDGAKAAEDTARNAAAQVKAGGGMNRTGDQKTGDKNIVKSTEAE